MTRSLTREDAAEHVARQREMFTERYSLDRDTRHGAWRRIKLHRDEIKLVDAALCGCLAYEDGVIRTLQGLLTGGRACGTVDETLRAVQRRRADTDAHVAALPAAPVPDLEHAGT